jgi:hypothetical protein
MQNAEPNPFAVRLARLMLETVLDQAKKTQPAPLAGDMGAMYETVAHDPEAEAMFAELGRLTLHIALAAGVAAAEARRAP